MKIDQINVFHVSQLALDANLNPIAPTLSSFWILVYCVNANKGVFIVDFKNRHL